MTPTHAISADEARRLLAEDRARRVAAGVAGPVMYMFRTYYSPDGWCISPGLVNRDAYPEIPDGHFWSNPS